MSQNIGLLGWGPGHNEVGQKCVNLSPLWRKPQKKQNEKLSKMFNNVIWKTSRIFRGFEQLSSSIGWEVMVVQSSAGKVAHAGLKG